MSTDKNRFTHIFSYDEVMSRVKANTDIKNQSDIADLVGVKQSSVSLWKKKGLWPIEWAYLIASKYELLTEWLLTGKGPKRIPIGITDAYRNSFLHEIDEWLDFLVKDDSRKSVWFSVEFEKNFPMFEEWKKRREEQERENTDVPNKNVA